MYKGQLQFRTGYEFSLIRKMYDPDGEKIDLKEKGTVCAKHLLPFSLKFGVLDYIQLSAASNYASMGIRSQWVTTTYLGYSVNQTELINYKGFDDLYLGLDLSAPFKWEKISWALTGGIHLPVFGHEPDKPSHSYALDQESGDVKLEYIYNSKFGSGIPVSRIGTSVKLRTNRISLKGRFHYLGGMKEGESVRWIFRLEDNRFEYEEKKYNYHPGNQIEYYGELAFQAIDWFTVIGSFQGYHKKGGWSNVTGKKVRFFDESLNQLSIGFEILISPLLRVEQCMLIPVSGKDVMGQWIFVTGISFNFISTGYNSLIN
jgi:hypothetical protein